MYYNKPVESQYLELILEVNNESIIVDKMGYTLAVYEVLKKYINKKRLSWYANQLKDELLPSRDIDMTDTQGIEKYLKSPSFKNIYSNIEDWIVSLSNNNIPVKLNNYNINTADEEAKKWHKDLEVQDKSMDLSDEERLNGVEIIQRYSDGYYWLDLKNNSCSLEGERMGHCGTTSKDKLLSLRDRKNNPHVTVSITDDHDVIGQIKGKSNTRPHNKYDKYIVDIITRLGVEEYEPEFLPSDDFQPYAIKDDELKVQLRKNAPSYYASTEGLIEEDDYVHWDYIRRFVGYDNATDEDIARIKKASESYYLADMSIFKGQPIPEGTELDLNEDFFESLKKRDKLPKDIKLIIYNNPAYSFWYVKNVIRKPYTPLEGSIAKDSEYAYKYALDLLKGEDVSDVLLNSISKNSEYATGYARFKDWKDIPDVIVKSLVQSPEGALNYITKVVGDGGDIDKDVLIGLSKDSDASLNIAKSRFQQDLPIPDVIYKGIAKNSQNSNDFVTKYLKYKNVNDILISGLSKDPRYALNYAIKMIKYKKEVPEEVVTGISSSSPHSLEYARELNFEEVPEKIINKIADEDIYAKTYIEDMVFKNGNIYDIPKKILSKLSENSNIALSLAINLFNGKNVPEIVLAGFDDNKKESTEYGVFKKGLDLSDSLVDTISKYPSSSLEVALSCKNIKEMDNRIINSIIKSPSALVQFKKYLSDTNQDDIT